MREKVIEIGKINPVELFGANDEKLKYYCKYFPKLKVVARGTSVKILGSDEEMERFEDNLALIIEYFNKFNSITESQIDRIMMEGEKALSTSGSEILVYGNSGMQIKARTANQRKMVDAIDKDDMLFAIGPAGTGKTYTAVALAVRALKNKEVKRIILTRPAVEAGEHLGFLPGDLKEKLDPYMQPLYDGLRDMIPHEKLEEYIEKGTIQIAPLAFMRGRTLDKAFVILDEAQNATSSQLKMFLTRMGKSSKFVVTGDPTQLDLPKKQMSGLAYSLERLEKVKGISMVYLDGKDVIRHKLVKRIIEAFDK